MALNNVQLEYTEFRKCYIAYDEIKHSFPRHANVRYDLATSLGLGAEQVGAVTEARQFRIAAILANQSHLKAAVLSSDDWHVEHFPPVRQAGAAISLLLSWLDGLLWGHGERWGVVVRNLFVLSFLIVL